MPRRDRIERASPRGVRYGGRDDVPAQQSTTPATKGGRAGCRGREARAQIHHAIRVDDARPAGAPRSRLTRHQPYAHAGYDFGSGDKLTLRWRAGHDKIATDGRRYGDPNCCAALGARARSLDVQRRAGGGLGGARRFPRRVEVVSGSGLGVFDVDKSQSLPGRRRREDRVVVERPTAGRGREGRRDVTVAVASGSVERGNCGGGGRRRDRGAGATPGCAVIAE